MYANAYKRSIQLLSNLWRYGGPWRRVDGGHCNSRQRRRYTWLPRLRVRTRCRSVQPYRIFPVVLSHTVREKVFKSND